MARKSFPLITRKDLHRNLDWKGTYHFVRQGNDPFHVLDYEHPESEPTKERVTAAQVAVQHSLTAAKHEIARLRAREEWLRGHISDLLVRGSEDVPPPLVADEDDDDDDDDDFTTTSSKRAADDEWTAIIERARSTHRPPKLTHRYAPPSSLRAYTELPDEEDRTYFNPRYVEHSGLMSRKQATALAKSSSASTLPPSPMSADYAPFSLH